MFAFFAVKLKSFSESDGQVWSRGGWQKRKETWKNKTEKRALDPKLDLLPEIWPREKHGGGPRQADNLSRMIQHFVNGQSGEVKVKQG